MVTFSRLQFINKLIRGLLIILLAFIALMLGSKAVKGKDCCSCPGNGICKGEADCNKY